jgi:hypothetical protein
MWRTTVELSATFEDGTAVAAHPQDFSMFAREVARHMFECGASNPDLRGSAMHGELTISVDSPSSMLRDEVIGQSSAIIRGALHAAGASTRNWPDHDELVKDETRFAMTVHNLNFRTIEPGTDREHLVTV